MLWRRMRIWPSCAACRVAGSQLLVFGAEHNDPLYLLHSLHTIIQVLVLLQEQCAKNLHSKRPMILRLSTN